MKTANISFRKTIVCAIACIILSAVIMVQVSADHYSSWEYLTYGPMPYYYNYGSRSCGVLTSTGFYSRGEINYPGYTYDITTIDEVTLVYANNFSNTYVDDWYYNDFREEFDLDFLPAQQYRNVTSLEAPEIPLYTGVTLMHSIALTTAVFSDFVYDPDYGDYNRWYIYTNSHQIHSINHNPSLCEICSYYGN